MLSMKSIKLNVNEDVEAAAIALGARIKLARTRRKIKQTELASKTFLSRSTIQAIERGEVSYSIGALLTVLWTLGLMAEIGLIADPGLDRDGLTLAISAESKRVGVVRKVDNDF